MQQHPIPQNITGFEFKLVGALTLKQFLHLAGAGIVCFVLFVSIGSFIKWFFIIPAALVGLASAFLPINGMPFDKWVVAFIAAISSPARRIWYKEPKIIGFLAPEFSYYLRRSVPAKPAAVSNRGRLQAFFNQTQTQKRTDKLDIFRQTQLSSLDFGGEGQVAATPVQPTPAIPLTSLSAEHSVPPESPALAGPTEEGPESERPLVLTEIPSKENAPEKLADQEKQRERRSRKWQTNKRKGQ